VSGSSAVVGIRKPAMRYLRALGRILYGTKEGESAIDLLLCNFPRVFTKLRGPLRYSSIVQSEQIWSALFPLLYRRLLNKVSVLDDHNVEATLASRMAGFVENKSVYAYWLRYVTALERVCCRLATTVVVTSERDREELAKVHGISRSKIVVIPNGVDLNTYRPDSTIRRATRAKLDIPEEDPVLIFVGRASYPPNRFAIDYIKDKLSPAVWDKAPNARFLVVSRDLPADYLAGDQRFVHVRDAGSDIPYINAADIALAPIDVGGGTRLKILNCMACGKAVVSTPMGCAGINATNGRDLIVSPLEEMPNAVNGLIEDAHSRTELGMRAWHHALSNFSWDKSVSEFDEMYDDLYTKNGN
jgi:glycosyltransferase involved in cell wall biosynthesis